MKTKLVAILMSVLLGFSPGAMAVVDDAHSFALEAATPYVKKGYTVREEHWAGALAKNRQSSIAVQLFKGNDYWFWLSSDEDAAKVNIHIYDKDGNLVDKDAWQRGKSAAARVVPEKTGTYYLVFTVTETKLDRTRWAVAYGFK